MPAFTNYLVRYTYATGGHTQESIISAHQLRSMLNDAEEGRLVIHWVKWDHIVPEERVMGYAVDAIMD